MFCRCIRHKRDVRTKRRKLFGGKLDEVLQRIPASEKVILAGEMNGHVGADRS